MSTRICDYTLLIIVIIGAINWGLIGFFNFNLVGFIFGTGTALSRIVYCIVGLSGLYTLSFLGRIRGFGETEA